MLQKIPPFAKFSICEKNFFRKIETKMANVSQRPPPQQKINSVIKQYEVYVNDFQK